MNYYPTTEMSTMFQIPPNHPQSSRNSYGLANINSLDICEEPSCNSAAVMNYRTGGFRHIRDRAEHPSNFRNPNRSTGITFLHLPIPFPLIHPRGESNDPNHCWIQTARNKRMTRIHKKIYSQPKQTTNGVEAGSLGRSRSGRKRPKPIWLDEENTTLNLGEEGQIRLPCWRRVRLR
jgi:hypothetical protein